MNRVYPKNNRVNNNPDLILNLNHGLTFASDSEVNARLLTRYNLYDYITPNDSANILILESIINDWSEYANKLYTTTLWEGTKYDPIENYDRIEEAYEDKVTMKKGATSTVTNNLTTSVNTDETTTTTPRTSSTVEEYVNGYNSPTASPSGKTVNLEPTGEDTTTRTGAEEDNYTKLTGTVGTVGSGQDEDIRNYGKKHVHGNIGVRSGQELTQQSRDLIIDVLDFYVAKFADAFDIAQDIAWRYFEEV